MSLNPRWNALFVLLFTALLSCSETGASFVCETGPTSASTGAEVGINDSDLGGQNIDRLAQSFEIGSDRTVSGVRLNLQNVDEDVLNSGTITVSLQSGASAPSGTPLVDDNGDNIDIEGTIDIADITETADDYDVAFAETKNLSANTRYWIVVEASYAGGPTDLIQWRASTDNSYSDGQALYESPANSWIFTNLSGTSNHDFLFRILCENTEE